MTTSQTTGPLVPGAGASFAQWLVLHLTGLMLAVFVFSHIWSVHYSGAVAAEGFTFAGVAAKLSSPLYRFFDLGLLVLALFHGLLGTQRVIVDLGLFGRRALRVVDFILVALGLVGLGYGWSIYRAFLR